MTMEPMEPPGRTVCAGCWQIMQSINHQCKHDASEKAARGGELCNLPSPHFGEGTAPRSQQTSAAARPGHYAVESAGNGGCSNARSSRSAAAATHKILPFRQGGGAFDSHLLSARHGSCLLCVLVLHCSTVSDAEHRTYFLALSGVLRHWRFLSCCKRVNVVGDDGLIGASVRKTTVILYALESAKCAHILARHMKDLAEQNT